MLGICISPKGLVPPRPVKVEGLGVGGMGGIDSCLVFELDEGVSASDVVFAVAVMVLLVLGVEGAAGALLAPERTT